MNSQDINTIVFNKGTYESDSFLEFLEEIRDEYF
mgnify:CR=1 FL=1